MSDMNNNGPDTTSAKGNDNMDGGPISSDLYSDNSFSDQGLNNARLTRESMKKANSQRQK